MSSQVQIATSLAATNFTRQIQEQLKTLIGQYITGAGTIYLSTRLLSNPRVQDQAQVPCVMIQPVRDEPSMPTTGKYNTYYVFHLFFVQGDEDPENLMQKMTDIGNIFQKLFSNNALGDLGGANSNKFRQNLPYWVDSEMSSIDYSVPIANGKPGGKPAYIAIGDFSFRAQTRTIK